MMARWMVWLFVASAICFHSSQVTSRSIGDLDVPAMSLPRSTSLNKSFSLQRSDNSQSYTQWNPTPLPIWQFLEEKENEEVVGDNSDEYSVVDGSGEPEKEGVESGSSAAGNREVLFSRPKRKVISRGGHYIIRSSSSGNSPWSSTSYDTYSTYRTSRPRGYGWNPRGRIGDGGTRTGTFGGHLQSKHHERRSPRKKLTRSFKGEIAQYAMLYGATKAALHYEHRVGRRLKDRVVHKFVQRYQERVKKSKKKSRS